MKCFLKAFRFLLAIIPIALSFALPNPAHCLDDEIIDNLDVGSIQSTGTWTKSNGINPYSTDSVWGQNNATFTWRFTCPETGEYEVYEWHTVAPSRTDAAPLLINSEGAPQTLFIDQTLDGGQFNLLGTYDFVAGSTYNITITAAEYSTGADAMMFRLLEPQVPVANFTTVMDLLEVSFTDTSTGVVTTWDWDFGDSQTSTDQNPVHTYTAAGTYTVSLTVNGPGGNDITSQDITISDTAPVPPVAIIDSAAPSFFEGHGTPEGTIDEYSWTSSLDGTLSNQPSFTPVPPLTNGTHTITFRVRNTDGLWSDEVTTLVTVGGGSNDFIIDNRDTLSTSSTGTWSNSNGVNPYNTNSVWGQNNATFTWRFTCPETGEYEVYEWHTVAPSRTDAAPLLINSEGAPQTLFIDQTLDGGQFNLLGTYDFVAGSTYNITITAAEYSTGADAMMFRLLEPQVPVANFTTVMDLLEVSFTDTSTGVVTTWDWDFGDSQTSTDQNPVHTYTAAGTYTVSLTVNGPGGNDITSQDITISDTAPVPPVAIIDSAAPSFFEGHGTPEGTIDEYSWTSSLDGTLSNQPSFTPVPPLTNGTHTITFRVRNTDGLWSDEVTTLVTVGGGSNDFIIDNRDTLSTSSTGTWSNSNGVNPYNTNSVWGQNNATFTWRFTCPETGEYEVYEWHTVAPSRTDAAPLLINSEGAPQALFIDQTLDGGQFNLLGTYDFVAGSTYNITITAAEYSTGADAMMFRLLEPQVPVANFTTVMDLLEVSFTDTSTGVVTTWDWDFGDSQTSTDQNPVHTYATVGPYEVSLTVSGPTGGDTIFREITVSETPPAPPIAVIDSAGPVFLEGHGTPEGTIDEYSWTSSLDGLLSDQPSFTPTPSLTNGTHTITFRVRNTDGLWSDEVTTLVTVGGGSNDFIIDNRDTLSTSSTGTWSNSNGVNPYNTNSVWGQNNATFTWRFTCPETGEYEVYEWHTVAPSRTDAAPLLINSEGAPQALFIDQTLDGGQFNLLGTYDFVAGSTYNITITAAEYSTGADAMMFKLLEPAVPVANFTIARNLLEVNFTDTSTGVVTTWDWNFGDGQTSTEQNPVHTYVASGTYTVNLTVDGPGGTDIISREITVSDSFIPPVAAFSATPRTSGTFPLDVLFWEESTGDVTNWLWDFGDGQTSTMIDPTHTYLNEGNYTVSLTVSGPSGTDTHTETNYITIEQTGMVTEHIYACAVFSHGPGSYSTVIEDIGATQIGPNLYRYTNNLQNKEFIIHLATDVSGMIEAFTSPTKPVVLVTGHSNYGLGPLPSKGREPATGIVEDFYYMDDIRILNLSSYMVAPSISGMIESQAYPNWQPIFRDGTSSIMPFRFVDPAKDAVLEDPPYNYYITYQKPNDPTLYRIESGNFATVERFPGSGRPPWDPTTDGFLTPDPTNPDDIKYYYTKQVAEADAGWSEAFENAGYYGDNYYTTPSGSGDIEVTWYFISPDMDYQVYAWWPASVENVPDAHYTLTDGSGSVPVIGDQTLGGGQWNLIGEGQGNGLQQSVTVSNEASGGNVIADAIRITHPDNPPDILQANFYARTRSGTSPLEVEFYNDSTGTPSGYLWDFGDGSQSTDKSPTHIYTASGTYAVSLTLTVTDPSVSSTLQVDDYIWVDLTPPVIQAEFDDSGAVRPTNPVPATVYFRDRSSGEITSWAWDFDNDGIIDSTDSRPSFTFTTPGLYDVTLTVRDEFGNSATKTKQNLVRAVVLDFTLDNNDQPTYHYSSRTMMHRKELEIPQEAFTYSKLVYDSCNSGPYYLDTFKHGTVFYSVHDVTGHGSFAFLRAYITGERKSDYELWTIMQNVEPYYNYYNFNKAPSEQD